MHMYKRILPPYQFGFMDLILSILERFNTICVTTVFLCLWSLGAVKFLNLAGPPGTVKKIMFLPNRPLLELYYPGLTNGSPTMLCF